MDDHETDSDPMTDADADIAASFRTEPIDCPTGNCPSCLLTVIVVDRESGDPIQGAAVDATGPNFYSGGTNPEGRFVVAEPNEGEYRVTAGADGYLDSATSGTVAPDTNNIVTLSLEPCELEIVDARAAGGDVLNGQSQREMVGRKIQLRVRLRPSGHEMRNIRWQIPSAKVKDYTLQTQTSDCDRSAIEQLDDEDLGQAEIAFYWIDAGGKRVRVSAEVEGTTLTAETSFEILRPTVTGFTLHTSCVTLCDGNYLLPGVRLAAYDPSQRDQRDRYGMRAQAGVSVPAEGAGRIGFTQLAFVNRTGTDSRSRTWDLGTGGFLLDDAFGPQYDTADVAGGGSATLEMNDSPSAELESTDRTISVDERFQLFLMYCPSGSDNIWVTLARGNWTWAGEARQSDAQTNIWEPVQRSGTGMTNDARGADSTGLPSWRGRATAQEWREMHGSP